MPLKIAAFGASDIGLVRQKNEDVWGQVSGENLFVLADGMGGHRAGDVAAKESVRALCRIMSERLKTRPQESVEAFATTTRLAIEEVNRLVYDLSKTEEDWRGMGTTICCIHLQPDGLVYAHVGDSRIYRFRHGTLQQLTEDHSLLREMMHTDDKNSAAGVDFLYKNIITKAIGTEPIVEPSVGTTDLQIGDIILMCTDGLTDLLPDADIKAVIQKHKTLPKIAEALILEAKAKGGHDNITVVLAKVQDTDASTNLPR